jgi:hypothetical protein
MRLKKKFVPQKFYTPPPGISNGLPLIGLLVIIQKYNELNHRDRAQN